jgi:hypothetical protein
MSFNNWEPRIAATVNPQKISAGMFNENVCCMRCNDVHCIVLYCTLNAVTNAVHTPTHLICFAPFMFICSVNAQKLKSTHMHTHTSENSSRFGGFSGNTWSCMRSFETIVI